MFARGLRESGFNLLEVVIACFIFSVSTVAFLGVWGMQARASEKSRHQLVATALAEFIIEEYMAKGYEQVDAGTYPEDPEEGKIQIDTEILNPSTGNWDVVPVFYTHETVVTDLEDPDDDKLKSVLVTVTWTDTSRSGKVQVETELAGLN